MAGGTPVWEAFGYPLFGMEASAVEIERDDGIIAVNAREFNQLFATEEKAVIIDVRTASEIASGMLTGAVHIDSVQINADIASAVAKLPADKSTPLLIYCAAGVRSYSAGINLFQYGYENVYYLDGRPTIDAEGNLVE